MTEQTTYSGIDHLRVNRSVVKIAVVDDPHRRRQDWFGSVRLDGEKQGTVEQHGTDLLIEAFHGTMTVTLGRRIDLTTEESEISGQHLGGELNVTGGTTKLSSPPTFPKPLAGIGRFLYQSGKDLLGIAVISLPMLAITTVVAEITGARPMEYVDIAILTAAGTYVGVAGKEVGSFLRTTALAVGIIYAPEILTGIERGLDEMIQHLGLEDICKTLWYGTTWSLGAITRNYFRKRTRNY